MSGGDPSGVPRPVAPGRVEKAGENSGVMVGETKVTNPSTGQDQYKTEFVKVYQDAGVVGVSMLTLLVLCLLLGLFCSRLIKMYTALTASRDALEATRTSAIEKLTTSVLLLRSEMSSTSIETRRLHDDSLGSVRLTNEKVERAFTAINDKVDRAFNQMERNTELLGRVERDYLRRPDSNPRDQRGGDV